MQKHKPTCNSGRQRYGCVACDGGPQCHALRLRVTHAAAACGGMRTRCVPARTRGRDGCVHGEMWREGNEGAGPPLIGSRMRLCALRLQSILLRRSVIRSGLRLRCGYRLLFVRLVPAVHAHHRSPGRPPGAATGSCAGGHRVVRSANRTIDCTLELPCTPVPVRAATRGGCSPTAPFQPAARRTVRTAAQILQQAHDFVVC